MTEEEWKWVDHHIDTLMEITTKWTIGLGIAGFVLGFCLGWTLRR